MACVTSSFNCEFSYDSYMDFMSNFLVQLPQQTGLPIRQTFFTAQIPISTFIQMNSQRLSSIWQKCLASVVKVIGIGKSGLLNGAHEFTIAIAVYKLENIQFGHARVGYSQKFHPKNRITRYSARLTLAGNQRIHTIQHRNTPSHKHRTYRRIYLNQKAHRKAYLVMIDSNKLQTSQEKPYSIQNFLWMENYN